MSTRDDAIELIATTIVNQKFMRNGSPPFSNPLEVLPSHLRDQVMEDAEAVYDALHPAEG